jgi:hypothetical protein
MKILFFRKKEAIRRKEITFIAINSIERPKSLRRNIGTSVPTNNKGTILATIEMDNIIVPREK